MASRAGNALENRVRDYVAELGYFAMCGRASRGPADVLAVAEGRPTLLIQVKGDQASPWANFRKADREALRAAARVAGGEAWLVWWPKRDELPHWFLQDDWPS